MKTNFKPGNQATALAFLVMLFFVASSCNTAQTEKKADFDLANAKKEIEAANQNFIDILSKSDSVGLADCYAGDAKLMMSNAPAIVGKKNIQTAFGGMIKAGITKVELKTLDVWGTDDVLTEEGELTISTKDGKLIDKGKYIVVWKKEDNKWKLLRDFSSSDLPAPAMK